MPETTELLSTLNFYHKNKLSYFPLPHGAKKDDTFKWGEFQKRRPTAAESRQWFGNGDKHNVAVVCGEVSQNLVVLDCDSEERFYELARVICDKLDIDDILNFTRVSQTGKGYHIWLFTKEPTLSAKFPKLDIKGEGGYIVAPVSLHPEGATYKFVNPNTPIKHIDNLVDIGINLNQNKETPRNPENWITTALGGVGEGDRNDICYKLAAYFKNSHPIDITEKLMLEWNTKNKPPLEEQELLRTIKSAYTRTPLEPPTEATNYPKRLDYMPKQLTNDTVLQWVSLVSGNFNTRQMWAELNITTPESKSYLRVCLNRLVDSGVIAKTSVDGTFRRIDNEKKIIDWQAADLSKTLPIILPFGIHKICHIYPKSIIIVAGSKNQGKTSFLLECIKLNMSKFIVDLYNSETGPEQLKERLSPLEIPEPAPFNAYERYDNFADVIEPEHLSIIDYLDFNSEVYLVGTEIDKIFRKLRCCAIIGLQKPPPSVTYIKGVKKVIERDLAYGGGFTAKRAVLYISLSSHRLKLVYVKTPANPRVNPDNMQWSYSFDENGYFTNIQRYYGDDTHNDTIDTEDTIDTQ